MYALHICAKMYACTKTHNILQYIISLYYTHNLIRNWYNNILRCVFIVVFNIYYVKIKYILGIL